MPPLRLVFAATLLLGACEKSVYENPALCKKATDCTAPLVCDTQLGQCLPPCRDHADCPGDRVCAENGLCVGFPSGCKSAEDCGDGATCDDGACRKLLALGAPCAQGARCESGACHDGVCCESPCAGTCVSCLQSGTNRPDGQCASIVAGLDPQDECAGQLACDGAGACFAGEPGAACAADVECAQGTCVQGECSQCGDGVVSGGETCDDGNTTDDGNGCDSGCQANNTCGDGVWEPGAEGCDDGNTNPSDGCSSTCQVEPGYGCRGQLSVCGTVIYVDANAPTPVNGLTWATAYNSLAAALAERGASATPREIWVAQGTYVPGSSRGDTFELYHQLAIYGGFTGVETARDQRDPIAHPTILSGDVLGNDHEGGFDDNVFHVVRSGANAGSLAVLDGFIIRGGRDMENAGGNAVAKGGGIYVTEGTPLLQNLVVEHNAAVEGGGAYVAGGAPRFEDVLFRANEATHGGGAYAAGGTPSFVACRFDANRALANGGGLVVSSAAELSALELVHNVANQGGGILLAVPGISSFDDWLLESNLAVEYGGGLYAMTGSPTLSHITLVDNWAVQGGGGAYLSSGNPVLEDALFERNSAIWGGGAYINAGQPRIRRAVFSDNLCFNYTSFPEGESGGGGALYNAANNPRIEQTLFWANEAVWADGGAIYANGPMEVWSSVFAFNRARNGGVILDERDAVFRSSTFYANHADEQGGVSYGVDDASVSDTRWYNSIAWDNTAADGFPVFALEGASTATVEHSCVQGGFAGEGNLSDDPRFVNAATGDLHLQASSPAVNAGDNSEAAGSVDFAGAARIQNSTVDMGAYESAH